MFVVKRCHYCGHSDLYQVNQYHYCYECQAALHSQDESLTRWKRIFCLLLLSAIFLAVLASTTQQ